MYIDAGNSGFLQQPLRALVVQSSRGDGYISVTWDRGGSVRAASRGLQECLFFHRLVASSIAVSSPLS